MTKEHQPTRRDLFKFIGGAFGLSFTQTVEAEGKDGNPFFTKKREMQIKELQSKPYTRDVEKLTSLSHSMSHKPLALLVCDTDKIHPETLSRDPRQSHYFSTLKTLFGDEDLAIKEIEKLAQHVQYIQQGRMKGGLTMMSAPNRAPVRIVVPDTQKKIVDYNDRFGLPLLPSKKTIEVIAPSFGGSSIPGETQSKTETEWVSQVREWGFREDLNAPIYRAFSDYVLAARAVHGEFVAHETAAAVQLHHCVAENYAALKLAKQYGSAYPARIIAATHVIRAIYSQDMPRTYSDIPHSIRLSVPLVTGFSVQKAADVADELVRLAPEKLHAMTDKDLYYTATLIAENYALSSRQIDYLDAKVKAIMKLKTVSLDTAKEAIANSSLLNPENPIDKMIIDSHLLLFSKLKVRSQGQKR